MLKHFLINVYAVILIDFGRLPAFNLMNNNSTGDQIVANNNSAIENFRIAACADHMNLNYGPTKDWQCSLFENEMQTKLKASIKGTITCLCTYKYECLDMEEFVLDSELVNVNEYMKKEYYLKKNFYTQNCEQGLTLLTDEKDWSCLLKYDRFHLDEYYCKCIRIKTCQINKLLDYKI